MIRKIYAMSIVVLMLSVVIVGSVSAFTSDDHDDFIDYEFDGFPVPDSSYDWSYPDNPIIWIGAGLTNLASDPDNWDLGIVPTSEHDVIFDGTSVKNCTWDIDATLVTVNSLMILTGYTGTFKQGDVDIGIGAGGMLTEVGTYFEAYQHSLKRQVICAGNFHMYGDVSSNRLNLYMIGDGTTMKSPYFFYSLNIGANVTAIGNIWQVFYALYVHEGKTLTLDSGRHIELYYLAVANSQIRGSIVGSASSKMIIRDKRSNTICDLSSAQISVPVRIYRMSSDSGDITLSLSSDIHIGSYLEVYSEHSTNKLTLDLNGHSLIANGITVKTRGAIVGDGTIINYGDLDANDGTLNIKGHYVQAGDGNITMQDGSYIDRLTVLPKASLHLGSDLYLGCLPTHHYNIFSPDGYGYWIDGTFYTVPIWESASDDEKPYIAIIFLVLVLIISIIGYHYRIVLLQLVSLLCLAYGISRYISHPVVEWYPIYLILTLAGIVMIIYSIIRR